MKQDRPTAGVTDRVDVMGMVMRAIESSFGFAQQALQQSSAPQRPELRDKPAFQFWSGVSGRRYVHTIFDLIGCPRVPACTYVLVRCDAQGRRSPLRIGTVSAEAWSLNLAEIRHRAAQLGANEVHGHLIASDAETRNKVTSDLQAGLFAEFNAEPAAAPVNLC